LRKGVYIILGIIIFSAILILLSPTISWLGWYVLGGNTVAIIWMVSEIIEERQNRILNEEIRKLKERKRKKIKC